MSCEECEAVQTAAEAGEPIPGYYVRVGNGNVQIVGCDDHVRLLLIAVRAAD